MIRPEPGSKWAHYNGIKYEVVLIANLATRDPERYPITVVYQGPNGKLWGRPLTEWHRSFTPYKNAAIFRTWHLLLLVVLVMCLSALARADDYESSEQAQNARYANNFLKGVYGRP